MNEEEARVVKSIFRQYLRRSSIRLVTNYLNRKSFPPRCGGKWRDSTVGVILSRETYNGVLKMGDVVSKLPELRIVGKRPFEKAQEIRRHRRTFRPRKKHEDPLMEGGVFCHNCGTVLFGEMRCCPECGVKQMVLGSQAIGQYTASYQEQLDS